MPWNYKHNSKIYVDIFVYLPLNKLCWSNHLSINILSSIKHWQNPLCLHFTHCGNFTFYKRCWNLSSITLIEHDWYSEEDFIKSLTSNQRHIKIKHDQTCHREKRTKLIRYRIRTINVGKRIEKESNITFDIIKHDY